MQPIQSFDEAFGVAARISEDSKRLSDFLAATQTTLEPFKKMFGIQGSVSSTTTVTTHQTEDAPDSVVARILAILGTAKEMLPPKDIAEAYEARGYPATEGPLNSAISGTLSYLYGRKKTVRRGPQGGYYLASRAAEFESAADAKATVEDF